MGRLHNRYSPAWIFALRNIGNASFVVRVHTRQLLSPLANHKPRRRATSPHVASHRPQSCLPPSAPGDLCKDLSPVYRPRRRVAADQHGVFSPAGLREQGVFNTRRCPGHVTYAGHPIAHFTPLSLSVIVLAVFTMSSLGGNRGKKRDNLEAEAPVAVKKGRHQPKNKKVVAEGPSRGSAARDDEWVRDFEGAGDDNDFVSETEVEAVRQASVQSPPATPRGQAVPEKGGASKGVVQGSSHGAHRQDPIASQGGAVAGSSRPTAVAAAEESHGEGDYDEHLVNRQWRGNAQDVIEAATKLWVDDMRFWNETEGNGLFKVIQDGRLYLLAITRGVPTPEIHRSIALPHSIISQHKIEDELQLKAAKDRATKVQSITLRVIHGWIFKSASRSRG
ncbi:hypothetical protein CBR_g46283 [Chara braunii]|uniref:Uncharacterized protein n=1 Tax=Chara braunii TaxID=69332 RepID=A0A388M076_CHABU|nr:hypothetical protein CBR_g46283 [Chara braunii]|eukprot:GBG87915.1 hypothetical protein CBR_g46283 [Chara braunii]